MSQMEQEFEEANREIEKELWECLDQCFKAGAPVDALKFLAWNAGATQWSPPTNVIQIRR